MGFFHTHGATSRCSPAKKTASSGTCSVLVGGFVSLRDTQGFLD